MGFDASEFQNLRDNGMAAYSRFNGKGGGYKPLDSGLYKPPYHEFNIARGSVGANVGTMVFQRFAEANGWTDKISRMESVAVQVSEAMRPYANAAGVFAKHMDTAGKLAEQIIEPKLPVLSSLATALSNLDRRLQPYQSFFDTISNVAVAREKSINSWRPVLMRGFSSDVSTHSGVMRAATTMSNVSKVLSQTYGISTTRFADLENSKAFKLAAGVQTPKAFDDSLFQGITEAIRATDGFGDHQLRDVQAETLPTYTPPTYQPRTFTTPEQPTVTAPDEIQQPEQFESLVEDEAAEQSGPYQLSGPWRILQPIEDTVHSIMNGPLMVRILFIDGRSIVIGVVVGGVLFFLLYSSS